MDEENQNKEKEEQTGLEQNVRNSKSKKSRKNFHTFKRSFFKLFTFFKHLKVESKAESYKCNYKYRNEDIEQ